VTVAIGIDLGGTNLRAAAFTGEGATPAAVHREPVADDRGPDAIVERVASAIERVAREVGAAGGAPAGVGIAAMLRDRAGTVANSPHLHWRDVPFGRLLATRLGAAFPVGVYNDVNAVTWGELVAGAARGCRDVLAVYVGTGIGGGVVVDGRLVEGTSNAAGEIGHVKVMWGERAAPCACGQRGCVEAYCGGAYVQRRIRAELAGGARSFASKLAGGPEHATPGHVDQAAAEGDDWALDLWAELAPLLAIALGNAVAVLNPERLVLGGGMLGRTPLLRDMVLSAMTLCTPTAHLDALEVVEAELGDDAGLVGAADLARRGVSIIR
jgi:glucokinase